MRLARALKDVRQSRGRVHRHQARGEDRAADRFAQSRVAAGQHDQRRPSDQGERQPDPMRNAVGDLILNAHQRVRAGVEGVIEFAPPTRKSLQPLCAEAVMTSFLHTYYVAQRWQGRIDQAACRKRATTGVARFRRIYFRLPGGSDCRPPHAARIWRGMASFAAAAPPIRLSVTRCRRKAAQQSRQARR